MADADKTLKLLIELGVIGKEDARAAQQLLNETAERTKALSAEMGVITVSAKEADKILAQTGDTAAKAGEKIEESASQAKKHAGAGREMHRVFGELNRIVPGLGEVMKAAFHPDHIGIIGSLLAFEGLKAVLEDIKAVENIKLADFTGDKAAVDAVRDSYEKARVAAQNFFDEERRISGAGMTAQEVAKRQIENSNNIFKAQEQFAAAQKKLNEAFVEQNEKAGVITHEEALAEKFALDVEYTKKKIQLDEQAAAAELAAKQQQLETERAQLAKAQADQTTDEANATAAEAAKVKHDKQKETAKANIESAQKTLEELGKSHGNIIEGKFNDETAAQLDEYYQKYVGDSSGKSHSEMFSAVQEKMQSLTSKASWDFGLTNFIDRTIGKQEGETGFAKYDGAKQQIAGAQAELKKLEESQFKIDLNAERGKKQLDETDNAVRKLSASVETLARQIPEIKADAAARLNNEKATQNLDLRAAAVKDGLADPGNIFAATKSPVASTAAPAMGDQTPWRYDYTNHPKPAPVSPETQARDDFNTVDQARDAMISGRKLSDNQMKIVQQIAVTMSGHAVQSDQVLATLNTLLSNQKSRNDAFSRQLKNIEGILSRVPRPN